MTKARNLSLLSAAEAGATADQTKADLNAIGVSGGRKNLIINGGFDVWQRGTSFTANAYSSDRWLLYSTGSTRAVSQQTFTVGQTDVPNNPKHYLRDVVTSVAGASNMVNTRYRIEDVASLSGNTVTASFWAKADAGKNIAVEFQQYFGTGGSPSANVEVAPATVTLTTSWAKYTVSAAIPSITGKTIGSNNNDFLQLLFYMDAGSDKNARTNSLGQQSGTFDFANVQLELGSVATDFEHRSYGEELALCQRYYQFIPQYAEWISGTTYSTNRVLSAIAYQGNMRVLPTASVPAVTFYNNSAAPTSSSVGVVVKEKYIRLDITVTAPIGRAGAVRVNDIITLNAEL